MGHVFICGHDLQQTRIQTGMVANLDSCHRNRENRLHFSCPDSRLRVRPQELGSALPSHVSPLNLQTQIRTRAYVRDSTTIYRISHYDFNQNRDYAIEGNAEFIRQH